MKFEIIREVKVNGDVFFFVRKDEAFIPGSLVYVTTENPEEQVIEELKRKISEYKNVIPGEEVVWEEAA